MTWYQLADYQGHEINEIGEVRHIQSGNILDMSINQQGQLYVSIKNTTLNRYENRAVGVLIADTFCPGRSADTDTVLHLNGDTRDNTVTNLMWATRWQAIAFHREMQNIDRVFLRPLRIFDESIGVEFKSVHDAALHTGCLPSQINYSLNYNESFKNDEHMNIFHRTYPHGHLFRLIKE